MSIYRLREIIKSPAPSAARHADGLIRSGLADFDLILRRSLVPAETLTSTVRP
jgi:hypothetical protein